MTTVQLRYLVPEGANLKGLQTRLQAALGLTKVSTSVQDRTYYDSFDWRIYNDGGVLEHITDDVKSKLVWRSLNSVQVRASERIKKVPKFGYELPAGHLRDGLDGVLEMRALMPIVRVQTQVHSFSMLDSEEKTVLRLVIEQHALKAGRGGKPRQLGVRLRILPVKGYKQPVKQAVKVVGKELDLEPAGEDLMLVALAAELHQPEHYSSKLELHLDPHMRADAATRAILLRLLDVIKTNEDGTKKDIDSEFLHDFRVAVRKTRSALTQIKGVFPLRVLEKYKTGFAWLGSVTGPTRDMDVYLLNFEHYRSSLPKDIQGDLDYLHEFLIAHQKKEQAILAKHLNSARYKTLLTSWGAVLHAPVPIRSSLKNAMRPAIAVADERIMRIYHRVVREGQAITKDSPAERLHDLRKSCKKLRYLMEFFQSLYPDVKIKELIKVLKSLQENLGDFQDYEVQAATLRSFSTVMMEEGNNVPPGTLMAMGVLVEGLVSRQHEVREEFAKRFANFASQEHQDKFHALFTLPRGEREAAQ